MKVDGVAIYLDNFAIIKLAADQPVKGLRARFLSALKSAKASLLFSGTNGVELAALTGASSVRVRDFLNEIEEYWVFVESNPFTVMAREADGNDDAVLSPKRMHAFFQDRKADLSCKTSLIDMSARSFCQLGSVVEWLAPHRTRMIEQADALDEAIKTKVSELRAVYEQSPSQFNVMFPPISFDGRGPATFVWTHLLRDLVVTSRNFGFKRGDGRDLCHAVIGSAYGSLVAVDKAWKRRIESLPKPSNIAKTFYEPELERLVAELEALRRGEDKN